MTVAAFKKKDTQKEPAVARGLIVFLNSDEEGHIPMTTGDFKNGQVLCRWHDDVGNLQGDWFYPEELHLADTEEVDELEIGFKADFDAESKESS